MINLLKKLALELEESGENEESEEVKKLVDEEEQNKHFPEPIKDIFILLSEISDKLDCCGAIKEAEYVDELIKKFADIKWEDKDYSMYDSKANNKETFIQPKDKKDKETKHHVPAYQQTDKKHLSTRYCPDHTGVMLGRIGENRYICPIDNKVFDYDEYGSISKQTETATNVPIPSRVFDPKEYVINTIN